MTNEQIEAVARAIGNTTNFDGDRMASRYTDSELRDMATAAIAAMPDRYTEGYAAAKAQAVGVADAFWAEARDTEWDEGVNYTKRALRDTIATMEPGA